MRVILSALGRPVIIMAAVWVAAFIFLFILEAAILYSIIGRFNFYFQILVKVASIVAFASWVWIFVLATLNLMRSFVDDVALNIRTAKRIPAKYRGVFYPLPSLFFLFFWQWLFPPRYQKSRKCLGSDAKLLFSLLCL